MSNMPGYCEIATEVCCACERTCIEKNQVFSAYSSHDKNIVEQIESAISNLNEVTESNWISWQKDMQIENALVFCEICKHICQSKAVLVELSDLNFNVLFEYGFSLGLGKKINPIVGTNFDFHNIERFLNPLLGIGLGKYEENKLFSKLLKKKFWEKEIQKQVYDFKQEHIIGDSLDLESNSILYIKNIDSPLVSDAIEREIENFNIDCIVDDAQEEKYNLIWYSKQIKRSFAAIIDLGLSHKTENLKHFLKCAFISGICVATGRRTLIINSVHAPKPSDIISFIKDYDSPKSASRKVYNFLNKHANSFSVINNYISTLHKDRETIFDNIDLGEHVAINDKYFIEKCFVRFPEYNSLRKKGYKIIIGRKGTGKSAAFFHFKSKEVKHNEIVIHQLFDKYNLNDIYTLTESFADTNEKNKITTAFWEFVLFLVIAHSIKSKIKLKEGIAVQLGQAQNNDKFLEYFDNLEFVVSKKSITEQLVDIINSIKDNGANTLKELKKRFYSDVIIELKTKVIEYLNETETKLYLNIDGLDSNIDIQKNKEIISLILFNLHEVCSNFIGLHFDNFAINLFLRTDLYIAFRDKITEKDKITKLFFSWQSEYLFQIINNRLKENEINHISDLLHESFSITNLMKKIDRFVYQRPRDYVFLFNNLIQIAQSLKKNKIDNKVFSDALEYYALHVTESFEAEFMALHYNVDYSELLTNIKDNLDSKLKNRIRIKKFIGLLKLMELSDDDIQPFLSYLLQIKFVLIYQNEKPIEWNKLSRPNLKLSKILEASHNRYLYFPDIIQKVITVFF